MKLTKRFTFDAAHRLYRPDLDTKASEKIYGKCANIHGHTYWLEVTVEGMPDENGWVIDLGSLKKIVTNKVIRKFDHCFINAVVDFIPTMEHLVQHIHDILRHELDDDITLYLKLGETNTSWVEYGDDE